MNAYLDERRSLDHVVELRNAAATERLARSGSRSMRERLANSLRAWASRLDGMNDGFVDAGTLPGEDFWRGAPLGSHLNGRDPSTRDLGRGDPNRRDPNRRDPNRPDWNRPDGAAEGLG